MLQLILKINESQRKWITRLFIIIGIGMAYSPYWITLITAKEQASDMSDTIVSIGWWILAFGLISYAFNLWQDVRTERDHDQKDKE